MTEQIITTTTDLPHIRITDTESLLCEHALRVLANNITTKPEMRDTCHTVIEQMALRRDAARTAWLEQQSIAAMQASGTGCALPTLGALCLIIAPVAFLLWR